MRQNVKHGIQAREGVRTRTDRGDERPCLASDSCKEHRMSRERRTRYDGPGCIDFSHDLGWRRDPHSRASISARMVSSLSNTRRRWGSIRELVLGHAPPSTHDLCLKKPDTVVGMLGPQTSELPTRFQASSHPPFQERRFPGAQGANSCAEAHGLRLPHRESSGNGADRLAGTRRC